MNGSQTPCHSGPTAGVCSVTYIVLFLLITCQKLLKQCPKGSSLVTSMFAAYSMQMIWSSWLILPKTYVSCYVSLKFGAELGNLHNPLLSILDQKEGTVHQSLLFNGLSLPIVSQ